MQITRAVRNAILAAITATDGVWDPVATFVGVYISSANQTQDAVLADLTLPSGDMDTAIALGAFGTAHELLDGSVGRDATLHAFSPADETEGTVLGGWYLADAATAGNLLAQQAFAQPIALPDETYSVGVIVRITVDPAGNHGTAVIVDG